ncbi:hypothetical protein [Dongia sp. agr-C8]
MPRRLVLFLTAALLWAVPAAAQNDAALAWQQIRDGAYGKCMADARFGAGTALQENCSCSADVVMSLISDDFKQAIATGTQAGFKGPKLKVDATGFNAALLQACPKLGAYIQ